MKYLFLLLPFLYACHESGGGVEKTDAGPVVATVDEAVSTPVPSLPIYDNFDDLAPLFEATPERPTLINFWATWCKPCVAELPYLEQLRTEYTEEELRIVLVSLDFPKQIDSKLKPFLQERELKSEVVVLTDGKTNEWIGRVDESWEGSIPATVMRNAEGSAFHLNMFKDYAAIRGFVTPFL